MSKEVIETVVEILGKSYHVKCPRVEVSALQQAAKHLDKRLQVAGETTHPVLSFERILMITALNLTHELLAAERQKSQYTQSVNQKLSDLNSRIDEALSRNAQLELQSAE